MKDLRIKNIEDVPDAPNPDKDVFNTDVVIKDVSKNE